MNDSYLDCAVCLIAPCCSQHLLHSCTGWLAAADSPWLSRCRCHGLVSRCRCHGVNNGSRGSPGDITACSLPPVAVACSLPQHAHGLPLLLLLPHSKPTAASLPYPFCQTAMSMPHLLGSVSTHQHPHECMSDVVHVTHAQANQARAVNLISASQCSWGTP